MIDDIKEAIQAFQETKVAALTPRDIAGINKINFELDLLKVHDKKPKKKTLPAGRVAGH